MILITGATGTIGSHLVRLLADRGEPFRAMSRTGGDVQADFDDPASLERAVTGVNAVFLLTAPGSPSARHDLALLDAAKSAGVERIVKLSAIGSGEKFGDEVVGAWHLEAEEAVRDSGMAWTVLRPSSFASNFLRFAGAITAGKPIPNLTGPGCQGIVDPRDVAAVAAEALTNPIHSGQTYTLTGPELLSVPQQADVLSRVLDRPIRTIDLPRDSARAQLLQSGMDSVAVEVVITGSTWAREGHNAVLTDDGPRVLGRPAGSFASWAHDHRAAFRS
ncbi:NAD(P)H-binding protein [Amycolatopsis sp.]|jgi:uncharacterized protein YbjT (DUF2867 family)|uniref:NAD(P)H-binding protein n=1 Tax=Amycolatopsis sp. TaxID=37632 RepID=UPI002DF86B05|nr:NAD(P)H-binding protein [Amycolatopsis sp.]